MGQTVKSDPNYYKKIIFALCLGWVAIWIYRTILTPIYPQIQESLGNISDTQVGLIASIYFLPILVCKFHQEYSLINLDKNEY